MDKSPDPLVILASTPSLEKLLKIHNEHRLLRDFYFSRAVQNSEPERRVRALDFRKGDHFVVLVDLDGSFELEVRLKVDVVQ